MLQDLIPLIVGFLLTTVGGGLLGNYFQNRAWEHRKQVELAESEKQTAIEVFESISRLMDKRLYRMRQFYWRIVDENQDNEKLEVALENYRQVLFEWNDTINRNRALTDAYFGPSIKEMLEDTIYELFSEAGRNLESIYLSDDGSSKHINMNQKFSILSGKIYLLNEEMITAIQEGRIGVFRES